MVESTDKDDVEFRSSGSEGPPTARDEERDETEDRSGGHPLGPLNPLMHKRMPTTVRLRHREKTLHRKRWPATTLLASRKTLRGRKCLPSFVHSAGTEPSTSDGKKEGGHLKAGHNENETDEHSGTDGRLCG